MRAIGIDISHWDVSFTPEAAKVKIDFVIHKLTEGLWRDTSYMEFAKTILGRFSVCGAYHFLVSGVPWQKQADAFVNTVNEVEGALGHKYNFFVCDFEETPYNLMTVGFVAMAMEWMRNVKEKTGRKVLLYANPSTYDTLIERDSRHRLWDLWVAQYPRRAFDPQTAMPVLPRSRRDWKIWQFTGSADGRDYGVGSKWVDVNVYNGTIEDMIAYFSTQPQPVKDSKTQTIEDLLKRIAQVEVEVAAIRQKLEEYEIRKES